MSEGTLNPGDHLLQNAAWLQRLARRLVSDEARADDLVQDAWVTALSRGPEQPSRGWLKAVLTNLARQGHRSEARRRDREELARGGAHSGADDGALEPASLVDRAIQGRELTDLVLALEEPFRTAILMRYYEGLPPRKIAAQLDAPVRTIDSRLARGISRLRERWIRSHRDPEGGLRALFMLAIPRPAPAAAKAAAAGSMVGPLGVILMNVKWSVAGALLMGTGGVALWWSSSGAIPEPIGPELALASTGASELDLPEESSDPGADRGRQPETVAHEGVFADPGIGPPVEPVPAIVNGRVRGPDTAPRAGVELELTAPGNSTQLTTSEIDGSFAFSMPPNAGQIRAVESTVVTVMAGAVNDHSGVDPLVVIAPACDIAGRVEDESGAPLAGADIRWVAPDGFSHRFEAVFDTTRIGEWRTSSDPAGAFAMERIPAIEGAGLEARLDGYETARMDTSMVSDGHIVLLMRRPPSDFAVAGRVVDRDGRPAPAARVSLGQGSTTTDANGEFRLDRGDALQATQLVAIRRGALPASYTPPRDYQGTPLWPEFVEMELGGAPLAISGVVVDGDGRPCPRIRVWISDPTRFGILGEDTKACVEYAIGLPHDVDGEEALNRSYWESVMTDRDGTFRLEGLLPRAYTLRVIDLATLQSKSLGPIEAGTENVELELPHSELRPIAGQVTTLDGAPAEGVRVNVYAWCYGGVSTSLGSGSSITDAEGRFEFAKVGTGAVRLWMTGDGILPLGVELDEDSDRDELEITAVARCHLQVDATGQPELADSFGVVAADGGALEMHVVSPDGVWTTESVPLSAARSPAVGVAQTAVALVLYKDGTEVALLDLVLTPGELVVVRP